MAPEHKPVGKWLAAEHTPPDRHIEKSGWERHPQSLVGNWLPALGSMQIGRMMKHSTRTAEVLASQRIPGEHEHLVPLGIGFEMWVVTHTLPKALNDKYISLT